MNRFNSRFFAANLNISVTQLGSLKNNLDELSTAIKEILCIITSLIFSLRSFMGRKQLMYLFALKLTDLTGVINI
jgi:hypothetical protein